MQKYNFCTPGQPQNRIRGKLFDLLNFVDLYGLIPLDTIWDIGNVIIDIVTGDKESLIFDSAAMMLPYLPAGATSLYFMGLNLSNEQISGELSLNSSLRITIIRPIEFFRL
ncbi:MAG: hypothetical protein V2I97_18765 [Desulfococcaceae bacterium]|nr:hypothetical protein [Desulfococcaceae bacterium]